LVQDVLAKQLDKVTNPAQVQGTIESYHHELDRVRNRKDLHGEFKALGNLGYAYRKSSDAPDFVAARCFQLQLKIARKLRDSRYEAIAQYNLRAAQRELVKESGSAQTVESKKWWWRFWN
jgi:hypothetical protein